MSKIALVVARPNSSRLPDKHNRMIGSLTVMDWIILHLSKVVDDIVICTTPKGCDYYKRYISERVKVVAPETDDNNVISRIKKSADIYKGKYYLIVSGDCPLVSVNLMKDLLQQLMMNRGFDACMLGEGTSHLGADAISWNGIQKLQNGEHLSLRLVPNLNIFDLFTLPNIYATFRATVDNQADLAFLRECYRLLGSRFSFENVSNLIFANPSINKLNEHVSQKDINFVTKKPNIALITKGNSKIGIGHVARSIALGQHLNECQHKHIHFYVNKHKLVDDILNKYGYIYNLDYSYGLPTIMENDFINWEFIYDTPHKITYNYGKVSPDFPVNYRINYIPHVIESDVVVTFGKGEFVKYGESIFNTLPVCEKHILYNVDNLPSYLKGAKRIITVWSQTAREAIALGKIPEVYSANTVDDKICKKLDKKGVLTWKGNMFQEINIY